MHFDSCFIQTLYKWKCESLQVFTEKIVKLLNAFVQGINAKSEKNYGHFLYFCNIRNNICYLGTKFELMFSTKRQDVKIFDSESQLLVFEESKKNNYHTSYQTNVDENEDEKLVSLVLFPLFTYYLSDSS